MIGSRVARRPLSSLRRSFPNTMEYPGVLWRRAAQAHRWTSGGLHRQERWKLLQAGQQGFEPWPHRLQGIIIQQRPHALPQQPLAAQLRPDGAEHSTAVALGRPKTPASSPWQTPRRDAARHGRRCVQNDRPGFAASCTSHCPSSTVLALPA